MMYLGDYAAGETVYFMWNSADSNGASITRSTDGTVSVYKDANTTQTTTGVTDTEDFDGLTGVHHIAIATSDGFYTTATDFMVVLSAATIDTRTVNAVLAHFSIENRPLNAAKITAGAITAAGIADGAIDAATFAAGAITATVIATGAIDADAIADGAIDAGAIAADAITAAKIADGAIDAATFAAGAITATVIATGAIDADALAADAGTEIGTAVWATTTRLLTALDEDTTTLDLDATIRAAVGLAAADLDTQLAALPTAAEAADAVWDEDATGHQTGGTFGQAIGDPGADTTTIYQSVVTDAAGTNIAADIIAIEGQTDDIGAAGAGLTAVPWNANWDAEVQSEVADALAVYDPPTKAELDTAVANVSVDEIQASAVADLFNTDSGTTYASAVAGSAVKEIADNAGGSALTEAGIADAVWDEDATGHQSAGTFGLAIGDPAASTETLYKAIITDPAGTNIAADVIAIKAETAAILEDTGTTLQAEVDGIQADTEDIQARLPAALVSGRIDASVGAVAANAITAAAVATGAIDADALAADAVDEIWDEVMEGSTTARQSLRLANSANGGILDGAATTTVTIRDLADSKDRVTATVDADGNRSAVTLDLA